MRVAVVTLFFALWFGPDAAQAACPERELTVFFINGISSEPEEGARELAGLLNRTISPGDTCDVLVQPAENRQFDKIADLCESALQLGLLGETDRCLDAVDRVYPDLKTPAALALFLSDSLNDVDLSTVLARRSDDLAEQLRLVRSELEQPAAHVVVAAHSQGNLFANEVLLTLVAEDGAAVLERVAIVSVATPASDVVGGGDHLPYVTLVEDFIHRVVPGALAPNSGDIPPGACGTLWDCHSFIDVYLNSPLSKWKIAQLVSKAAALGPMQVEETAPSQLIASEGDRDLTLIGHDFEPLGSEETAVIVVLPNRSVVRLKEAQILGITPTAVDVRITLADAGEYSLQVIDTSGRRSNVFSLVVASASNHPPAAAFTMTDATTTVSSGAVLTTFTDRVSGEARVTFTDASTDPDGVADIVFWEWATDTQVAPLATGPTSFTWGFRPGRYAVTLTVRDRSGAINSAVATVAVMPHPDSTPEVFFDPAADPVGSELFGSMGVSKPIVDSLGNVTIASYHPGPSYRLHSISPTAELRWTTPGAGQSVSIWFGGLNLLAGADDSTVVHDTRTHSAAFNRDGQRNAVWPPELPPASGNHFFAPNSPFVIDPLDGVAFAKSAITFSWTTFPMTVFAINADGTPKWQQDFDWGGPQVGLAQGPLRNVYTIQVGNSFFDQRLLALDRDTGSLHCEDRSLTLTTDLFGNPDGAFSAAQGEIFGHDENCQRSLFYSRAGFRATTKAVSGRTLLLSEGPVTGGAPERLLAVSTQDGSVRWRNSDIASARIAETSGSALYVFGSDALNDGRDSLFVLDVATGQRVQTVPTASICSVLDNCDVGVGPSGEVYLVDRAASKIWRVRN